MSQASELRVMDETGDTKLIWSADNQAEVDAARDMFKSLKKKNYIAYSVKDNGKKGDIIHRFEPDLEKIIMIPPIVGG